VQDEKQEVEDQLVHIEKEIESLDAQRRMLLLILGTMDEVEI
jgi:hypothetical protein